MINPVRGEAKAQVGDVEIVLAATMEGLAQVSAELGCQSFPDLYARLAGTELAATRAGIRAFTTAGSRGGKTLAARAAAEAALAALTLSDLAALQVAFVTLFAALTRDDGATSEKNGDSART